MAAKEKDFPHFAAYFINTMDLHPTLNQPHAAQSLKDAIQKSLFMVTCYRQNLGAGATWLFFALALGLLVRTYFLPQPMRGDEAYTFMTYANRGISALFEYSAPNNHVLNTLLIKLSVSIFGTSPASIRFPAFLAGLATIALGFHEARSLGKNGNSGIFAAVSIAAFPYLILYSTNARGYALIVLLSLMLAWAGYQLSQDPSRPGVILLALFSALGMLAIPIMALPIAGISLWIIGLLLLKKFPVKTILYRFVLPFGILASILTIAFYIPVIFVSKGVGPIISNKFVQPQSWSEFSSQLLPHVQKSFEELSRDIHPGVLLAVFALTAFGLIHAARQRNWGIILLLPCLLVGAWLVLAAQRTIPYARTWIYLIPFILLAADAGLAAILNDLPSRMQISVNVVLILMTLCFTLNLASRDAITSYPDTSAFPEAPLAVEYLKPIFKPGDTLRISPTADWPVYFYFWYHGIYPTLIEKAPSTGRIFFIAKKSRGPLEAEITQRFTLLLDLGNMALYQGER